MYKKSLVSVSLIMMLTACGSDSGSDADNRQFKGLTFTGTVYDGLVEDTEVSIYAGNKLLATATTDENGKYSVDAKIYDDEFDAIKSSPITYKAQRADVVLYEYAEKTLEQALQTKTDNAFISSFSTVEYVLADTNKNDFVSIAEWNSYKANFEQAQKEKLLVRYAVGLKAITEYDGSLAGFDNSTVWLRNTRSDIAWSEWIRLNDLPYQNAWDALFTDNTLLNKEAHNFTDIVSWKEHKATVVAPEPTPVTLSYVLVSGLPKVANVGDTVAPTPYAQWSNGTATDLSDDLALEDVTLTVSPAGAAEKISETSNRWRIKQTGVITFHLDYKGTKSSASLHADDKDLENIVLSDLDKQVQVGDVLSPIVSATWSDRSTTEVSKLATWTFSPAGAAKVTGQEIQILQQGEIVLKAHYQDATSTFTINSELAELTSLRVHAGQEYQNLGETFQLEAHGVHENGYIVDFSDQAAWTSSNAEIVEVNENGQFLAKSVGTATITATYEGFTASYIVNVTPKLTGITLNLRNNSVSRNQTVQLSLNGEFNDGSFSEIIEGLEWATSNAEILSIDEHGKATGHVEGTVTVTTEYRGFALEAEVTVTQAMIVSSTPEFRDGKMLLNEGQRLPYGFTFTRSNDVTHSFTHNGDAVDFTVSGVMLQSDESNIEVAKLDEKQERLIGVRAGEFTLRLRSVSPAFQQVLLEIGAIDKAFDSSQDVDLTVDVVNNENIYQWHKRTGNTVNLADFKQAQSVQYQDTVYRFWAHTDRENHTNYVTKVTANGETEAVKVEIPDEGFKIQDNQIQNAQHGYVVLYTNNEHISGGSDEHKLYRYTLADGTVTPISMSIFGTKKKINERKDTFQVDSKGNIVAARGTSGDGVNISTYDFATNQWTENVVNLPGESTQFASVQNKILTLDKDAISPILTAYNVETQQVETQVFATPASTVNACVNLNSFSVAARDDITKSAAGCLITKGTGGDFVGYWLWNDISQEPLELLFAEGYTFIDYPVAVIKPDGNVAFSAGTRRIGSDTFFSIGEVVDVEVDGVPTKTVVEHILEPKGKELDGSYSGEIYAYGGEQYKLLNPSAENEAYIAFSNGAFVLDADGNWTLDPFIYQLPAAVDHTNELFNLGNTLIITKQGATDQQYWKLDLRQPPVEQPPAEEPPVEEPPVEEPAADPAV